MRFFVPKVPFVWKEVENDIPAGLEIYLFFARLNDLSSPVPSGERIVVKYRDISKIETINLFLILNEEI